MATLKGSFTDVLPAIEAGVLEGLRESARDIMEVADVLVPKDTLTLAESRFIEEPRSDGGRAHVKFGFGRGEALNPKDGKPAGAYAVPVHEILEARHMPPTQAKFLETPCLAYEPKFGETMKTWISRFIKGESGLIASFQRLR